MSAPAVKICGLTRKEAVIAALEGGADFFGFVFHPPSPRHLSIDQAQTLLQWLPADQLHHTVAVTVNPEDSILEQILALPFGFLQLHGQESPDRLQAIKRRFGVRLIKALPISSREDLDAMAQYQDSADMLLFDAKSPDPAMPGGMGTSFDWSLLVGLPARLSTPLPWFLSGGITRENASRALKESGASMLDLSSSLESERGVKDPLKILDFLDYAKTL